MSLKILITDPISKAGIDMLRDAGMEVICKPDKTNDEIQSILSDVHGWIIRSGTKINKQFILEANKLQIIGRAGVGTDNIDVESATSKGIIVMNVPDGNTISAAEHTMAMLLSLSRNIQLGHMGLVNGEWNRHKLTGSELKSKILGVVGLGKIGREVIKRALSYDMKIIGYDPYVNQDHFDQEDIKVVDLDYLTQQSDYISIHVPMNDSTKNLFNYERLSNMKSTARIINVARGGIINEEDLSKALNNKIISGAAIDVFVNEPINKDHVFLDTKNILLTPHLGASTFEAKEGVSLSICKQIIDYFDSEKLTNAINIPIADTSIMKRMLPYYNLSEKMGVMASQLTDSPIKDVEIVCYGDADDSKSISLTFMKGLLSKITDNRVNMVNANIIARERGINFKHSYNSKDISYVNLIECKIKTENDFVELSGSVFSKNHLRVVNIMGFDIDLNPKGVMLFIKNKDVPGVVGKIGTVLGSLNINIAGYLLSRVESNDFAYAVIKLDLEIDKNVVNTLNDLEEIINIKQLIL